MKQIIKSTLKKTYIAAKMILSPTKAKIDGVIVATDLAGITPKIRGSLYGGGYEKAERHFLKQVLRPGHRYMEIGCGLGVLSSLACQITGEKNVISYEAVPATVKLAETTFRLNNISPQLIPCAVVGDDRSSIEVNSWDAFWSASVHQRAPLGEAERSIMVPTRRFSSELQSVQPDVCLMDIEGAEIELVDDFFDSPPAWVILETHEKVVGTTKNQAMIEKLTATHFAIVGTDQNVLLLRRREG